jgi:hypothetical protein
MPVPGARFDLRVRCVRHFAHLDPIGSAMAASLAVQPTGPAGSGQCQSQQVVLAKS